MIFHACDTAAIDLNASNVLYFAALGHIHLNGVVCFRLILCRYSDISIV